MSQSLSLKKFWIAGITILFSSGAAEASPKASTVASKASAQTSPQLAQAGELASSLDKVFAKYSTSAVQMNVERSTKSMMSKKDKKDSGEILLLGGKMRWSVSAPAKSLIVFDGKHIWAEEASLVDAKEVNVTKSKIEKSAGNLALLNILTGKSKPSKAYVVTKTSASSGIESFQLKPKDKSAAIQDVKIKVNTEKSIITQISYIDDIGNETLLSFSDVNLNAKLNSATFVYTPKSGSKVNEL